MAPMKVVSTLFLLLLTIAVEQGNGDQCCTSYTDSNGAYHTQQTCSEFCCVDLIRTDFKVCCYDRWRQVNDTEMNEGSCDDGTEDHSYTPILLGILIPLGIIACCIWGCCCESGRTVVTTVVTTVTTVVQ